MSVETAVDPHAEAAVPAPAVAALAVDAASKALVEEPVRYAGFWPRVLASLIDSLLLSVASSPLLLALYLMHVPGDTAFIVNWVLPGAAFVGFWVARAATPGKMALSLVVVDEQTLRKPDFWQALTRYIGYFVASIPLFAGLAWVAFDRRKQGWHDKMARTVVVYRKR